MLGETQVKCLREEYLVRVPCLTSDFSRKDTLALSRARRHARITQLYILYMYILYIHI